MWLSRCKLKFTKKITVNKREDFYTNVGSLKIKNDKIISLF